VVTKSRNPKSVVDSSGFPLQIRISDIAKSSSKWQIFSEEHPWRSTDHQSEGFIDLIIVDRVNSLQTMVIECKRVQQTSWVFLIPNLTPQERSHARLWVSVFEYPKWDHFNWEDWQPEPTSYESKYCAIPGQEQGRRNLLERSAAELIESVEALALQEKELNDNQASTNFAFSRVYIPVIVTTAELVVAIFEPNSISLSDGSLPDQAVFQSVPYIRFRKSLTSSYLSSKCRQTIKEVYQETERTVFVVNAGHFNKFINIWEMNE